MESQAKNGKNSCVLFFQKTFQNIETLKLIRDDVIWIPAEVVATYGYS